jgi:phage terminase large subunit-like protein
MQMDFKIKLPKAHEKQALFIDSKAKRKIIVAGRRGGKTTGASMLAAICAMDGRRVLEAAPVADQTNAFWESVKGYFAEPINHKIVKKNETDRLLEFPNGGRIRCKTAHDADTLRGDFCDLLILDEYSFMEPDAWELVGQPMLADNNGDAVFIFTPNRRNHAYIMYNRAMADDSGRWGAWHFTSMDNPYLSIS